MKYTYAYKSSDSVRHEGTMDASSRDEVFAVLRKKGIRPIKVVAADGAKANGEVRGVRKRAVVIIALAAAVIAGVVFYFVGERDGDGSSDAGFPDTAPRHQIYGDPVVIEAFERGHFNNAFTNRLDQMLAWFAQPGKFMCPKGTDPRRCANAFVDAAYPPTEGSREAMAVRGARRVSKNGDFHIQTLQAAVSTIGADEPREVRELKQIVNGLRQEMSAYLANGNGTPRSYWRRLIERTVQEAQIYERTKRELENEKSSTVWEEKNESLRRLGLRPIPNPKEAD